jgi:hypothetical protein
MAHVAELKMMPLGSAGLIVHDVIAPSAPAALTASTLARRSWWVKTWATGEKVSLGAKAITRISTVIEVEPPLLDAVTVKVCVDSCSAVGVPEIEPVAVLKVMPRGRVAGVML